MPGMHPWSARRSRRTRITWRLLILVCACLGPGCAVPRYLPIQLLGPFATDDSTTWYGSVGFNLRATEYQLEIGIVNRGTSAVEVAWEQASYYSPDQRVHSLIHADRLDAHNERLLRAQLEVQWHQVREVNPTYASPGQEHLLEPAGLWRIAAGQATEWMLIPAEHVRTDPLGTLVLEPLLCRAHYVGPLYFSIFVPVRIDGEWTTVRLLAQVKSAS